MNIIELHVCCCVYIQSTYNIIRVTNNREVVNARCIILVHSKYLVTHTKTLDSTLICYIEQVENIPFKDVHHCFWLKVHQVTA